MSNSEGAIRTAIVTNDKWQRRNAKEEENDR